MTRWWLFQSCNRLNSRNSDAVCHHLNGCQTGKQKNEKNFRILWSEIGQ